MMFTGRTATTHRLMIFLVAFSGLGALVAGQQYMSLQLEETIISARQTLEEVGSTGECNTCLQYSRWRLKSQRLSWTLIQA